ncbi:DUF5343 domain-containing protein [Bradyrhizobium sp. Bra78]|uniref:DUF5343 domain-containing protein n=1 Tax=Bradyrhizobium sp. Bra78 TaxID=2926010 RepID=UPI0021C5C006|nr:DUF5343 domain-containing protein [Bradyrhizobium sp. Bra78]
MAVLLPYLASNKNLPVLFEKIGSAKIPDAFNHEFLQTTIGLKGSNDRSMISLLRYMGFIDQSNVPTPAYRLLKGEKEARRIAWGEGVIRAYRPVFDADEDVYKHAPEKVKGLIAQVAGTDDDATARIASTFLALVKLGEFSAKALTEEEAHEEDEEATEEEPPKNNKPKGLRTEFQYVIQVQLPSNGTEETYLNIFNAIRKTFV